MAANGSAKEIKEKKLYRKVNLRSTNYLDHKRDNLTD